jgi:hypothetical protein
MRLILTEIKVMDAYERYYSNVPSYLWEEIVGRLQRGRNGEWIDELLPETKWVLKLYKDKSPRLVEDLYKLKNNNGDGYIDIFNRAKERRMLRGIEGDLFKYKSIADLGAFIETLDVDTILGRTKGEQSSDVNSAASNIEVPYEDDVWKELFAPKDVFPDIVILALKYDESTYDEAKQTMLHEIKPHDNEVFQYNDYTFYVNHWKQYFPENFTMACYNDENCALIFMGFHSSYPPLDEKYLEDIEGNWEAFVDQYYGAYYDFSQ